MRLEIITREPRNRSFETPLLFVHGSCHAAWTWDEYFLPYFAEHGFTAHAVSLRGHGKSETVENFNRVSAADYVADVAQTVSLLPRTPVVVGHSPGGFIVQKFLENTDAPAAILIAPSPSEGMFWSGAKLQLQNPWLFLKVAFKRDFLLLYNTPERAKKFLFSDDADDRKVAEYSQRFGKESYRAALEMIYKLPDARKINTPMLVLGAENDRIVAPKKIEKTARDYNAEYKIFPRMAHDMMLERNWRPVADFMIEWLEKKIQ
jgi:pimeloyl-ACP methyl ester carboxylesterase